VHAEDHDFDSRSEQTYQAGRLKTIDIGHAQIHNDQIRFQSTGFFYGVSPVDGFTADFLERSARKQRANAATHGFVIIHDQNLKPFGHFVRRSGTPIGDGEQRLMVIRCAGKKYRGKSVVPRL
jgi:hypothetical protein